MKKKAIFFFSAVFITCLVYGADSTQVKPFHRFYAGVSFTPGVAYRYVSHNFYNASASPSGYTKEVVEKTLIESRNQREKPGFGFDIGIKAGVRVTRFLSIETGLNYAQRSYYEKSENLRFGWQWNGSGFDSSATNWYVRLDYTYHYINVPVALHFNFGKGKINGVVNVGTSFDFLLLRTNKSTSNIPGFTTQTRTDNTGFNTFNLSPFCGVGIDYYLTRNLVLRIMPTAQMQALKNIDTPITEHLWSVGINTSLLFGFKKMKQGD